MTTYHNQLLYLSDALGNPTELINGARTAFNLSATDGCGSGRFADVLEDAGCEALSFGPSCVSNLLTANQSTIDSNTTGWASAANCSISRVTTQAKSGGSSLQMSATGAGSMSVTTPTGLSGVWVIADENYTITGSFRSAVSARTVRMTVRWYTVAGALISSATGGTVVDATSRWTVAAFSAVAPATASYAAVVAEVVSAGGASEIHYLDEIGIMWTPTTAIAEWTAGGSTSLTWAPLTLGTSANPWDNGGAAAADALGFYIEEWTGLDGAHHRRDINRLGRGGAVFGPQSSDHRVMKVNVLLMGASERGLNYLFRWLEAELLDCCSSGCDSRAIFMREFCPELTHYSDAELEQGWGMIPSVALIEGPTWESAPARDAGCFVRRCSFTLAAGDPCIYGVSSVEYSAVHLPIESTASATIDLPEYGSVAPRVRITSAPESGSGYAKSLPDLIIFGVPQQLGGPACAADGMPRVGELIISGYRASGHEVVVDLASRTVKARNLYGGDPTWFDASYMIARQLTHGTKRWWAFTNCSAGCVYVRPVYSDMYSSMADTTDTVSSWTVTIESVPRWSCC